MEKQQTIEEILNNLENEIQEKTHRDELIKKFAERKQLLTDFETANISATASQDILFKKQKELKEKELQLAKIQQSIIQILQMQKKEQKIVEENKDSLEAIPSVVSSIQKFLTKITEAAAAQHSISIPILTLLQVIESLSHLFDLLVEQGVIEETKEEKEARNNHFLENQHRILNKLQYFLQNASNNLNEEDIETNNNETNNNENNNNESNNNENINN